MFLLHFLTIDFSFSCLAVCSIINNSGPATSFSGGVGNDSAESPITDMLLDPAINNQSKKFYCVTVSLEMGSVRLV